MPRSSSLLLSLLLTSSLAYAAGDVRKSGAVGDGKTDDTAALQKAADAGGALEFKGGVYRLTKTITIDLAKTGYTSLIGDGTARVIMGGAGPAFRFIGHHGGSADPKTIKPETLEKERMPLVHQLEIVGEHAEADAIEATGTLQITVSETRISHVRHGVHLIERNRNVLVIGCHIYDNTGIGVFLDQVNLHQTNVTGCHISYCKGGGVVTRGGEVRNLHIAGSDIESNMGADFPPAANVEINSLGGSTAEVAITGCTLQHNSVSPGSANIRVVGPGEDRKAGPKEIKAPRWGHITIAANVFSDVRTNIELKGASGVVITGNTFWEGYEQDLLVDGCKNVVVGENNFERNPGYELWQKEQPKQGIIFRNSEDCTLNGLHINGVRQQPAALVVENSRRFHIANCTILDSDHAGILLREVKDSAVHGNFIRDDRAEKPAFKEIITEGGAGNRVAE